MGQSSSTPETREVSIEQISHELALRFADKCYTHLEIAHFRDNFKSLADHQDTIEYWKEETICHFLSIPSSLHAGPVIFQMVSYLGSFPFPSLAPCILTREAMIKVITILTGRYRKILKRGEQDKNKLLFRSLAVFDRRLSTNSPSERKSVSQDVYAEQEKTTSPANAHSHVAGFAIDEPLNDDEEEDEDDLALAALESLDAIEVFQHDQPRGAKIHRAHIPADYLHKLLMLMLLFAPVTPQDNLSAFGASLDEVTHKCLQDSASALIAAFDPDSVSNGVHYANFVTTVPVSLPNLFRPLNPLLEHFLFSKNIDLSKHKILSPKPDGSAQSNVSPIQASNNKSVPTILNDTLLAQLSLSLEITPTETAASSSFFHRGAIFSELYSTASHGTSMSSFSRQVLSWRSASLMLVSGTTENNEAYIFGCLLPDRWKETGEPHQVSENLRQAALFQLKPRHAIFHANEHNKTVPLSQFSQRTGISLGCVSPSPSRIQSHYQQPVLGPVSLFINEDIATAVFQHDFDAGTGAFCTDSRLEEAQRSNPSKTQPRKVEIDVDALEVWGISFANSGNDEIANQRKRLEWEEAEAARRRGVQFGGDKEGARALLEMAGLVGDDATNRSGGSV